MHESLPLDALTEALIGALQLHPRASWSHLAPILDVDASTLSRRWRRLHDSGLAWVTCLPSRTKDWFSFPPFGATVLIELEVAPGGRDAVAARVAHDARIATIEATTGQRGLVLHARFRTPREQDEYVESVLGSIPGIIAARQTPVREMIVSPAAWRTGKLPAPQHHAAVELSRIDAGRTVTRHPTVLELRVLRELGADGRRSAADIARRIGYSLSAVNSAIPRAVHGSGIAEFHVDFAAEHLGWTTMGTILLQAPRAQLAEIGAALWRYPGHVRTALALFGQANLAVSIWSREHWAIEVMEEMITTSFPQVRVADRWSTTRFYKRDGALLRSDGSREGFVDVITIEEDSL